MGITCSGSDLADGEALEELWDLVAGNATWLRLGCPGEVHPGYHLKGHRMHMFTEMGWS